MTGRPKGPLIHASPAADEAGLMLDDSDPVVGNDARGLNPLLIAAGFVLLAAILFLWLNARRLDRAEAATAKPAALAQTTSWSPPPLELAPTQISAPAPMAFADLPAPSLPPPAAAAFPSSLAAPIAAGPSAADMLARRRAPIVVVDLGPRSGERVIAQAGAAPPPAEGALAAAGDADPAKSSLTESEQFARRLGDEAPDTARATALHNPGALVLQGTVIPAVLETAINSDLPGFTRAVVSQDVMSFDGKAVLIPRGSRLIGQYKSAVALGQSRAFIIWTRVIRPDGASIQVGSPGTDTLGRGGLEGSVNRHFFSRFSGSILLSVLDAAVASVGQTPSTQISIGSPAAATSAAGAALQGQAIPPTIKVAQGAAIRIFVARDLDFASVGPDG